MFRIKKGNLQINLQTMKNFGMGILSVMPFFILLIIFATPFAWLLAAITGGDKASWEYKDLKVHPDETFSVTMTRTPGWMMFWESKIESKWTRGPHSYWWNSENPSVEPDTSLCDWLNQRVHPTDAKIEEIISHRDDINWTLYHVRVMFRTGDALHRDYVYKQGNGWYEYPDMRIVEKPERRVLQLARDRYCAHEIFGDSEAKEVSDGR